MRTRAKPTRHISGPLRSEEDLTAALHEIERLFEAPPGTREYDRLELLTLLVSDYERTHHPVPPPNPIEAIRFRLEQLGLTRKHLETILGSRSRVSEILSGKRPLTIRMMRALHKQLGIPAQSLLQETEDTKQMQAEKLAVQVAELEAKIASLKNHLPENQLWDEYLRLLDYSDADRVRTREVLQQQLRGEGLTPELEVAVLRALIANHRAAH